MSFASGLSVEVETSVSPPIRVSGADFEGPSSVFTRLLQPKVTVRQNGAVLYTSMPYGQPDRMLALVFGLTILFVLWLAFR